MKTLLYFYIFIFPFTFFAQNTKQKNAVIDYLLFINTSKVSSLEAPLYVNGQTTIFLEKFSTKKYENAKDEAKNVHKPSVDNNYLKIDHKEKKILSFEYLGANKVLVQDDYNDLNWNFGEETKVIGGYRCIKATVNYRGMDWVAWFTSEIPMAYGPWKLYGLPGLIIEAYNSTKEFTWRLEKIDYRRDPIFDDKFDSLVATKNKKPMSKKQYIQDEDERIANAEAQWIQQNPDISVKTTKVARGGYELKYEWEE